MSYTIGSERPQPRELADLFDAVGWGRHSEHEMAISIAAYPCTLCARTADGVLVGYLSAFSDEVMSTMLGELIVHPQHRRRRVGAALLEALEARYRHAPIYIKALGISKHFYAALGFKISSGEMTVMFKRPCP
jgi:GNAT superfamily N-acetyltransferase